MSRYPVLIVGAGPTGLMLALRLSHHGVPFRIVDRNSGPGQASRAMAVQARTLEFYDQLGLGDAVVSKGIRAERVHFREEGQQVAELSLSDLGETLTRYPFVLCFPQDDHERFLVDELAKRGVRVEWSTALTRLSQDDAGVRATLLSAAGEQTCEADYLCGCDGAHTTVRPELGIDFPGGTYEQLFFVADVKIDRPITGDVTINLGARSLLLMLPVRSSGMWRLIGLVPPDVDDRKALGFNDVRPTSEALLGLEVDAVNWFSTYRVHHRVADRFRDRRVFLCGDAGHLHSPAGGQGMNTGIGDAVNLSWKLANVVQGRSDAVVLDSYEPERIAFARTLVETTDRVFQGLVDDGWVGHALRSWIVPHLAPALTSIDRVRSTFFRTLSQTSIAYRDSPLSEGRAGQVHGGDRLPWVGANYASLSALDWRLHVYGAVSPAMDAEADAIGLRVDAFEWSEASGEAGLAKDAAYLVRPDGHVALALATQDRAALRRYADRFGLRRVSRA